MAKSRIEGLKAKIDKLEAERTKREKERAELEAVPTIDDEIQAAHAELKAAQADADEEAVERLRPKEQEQIEAVVKLARELKAAIEALGDTHREIASHRGYLRAKIAPALWPALRQAEDVWRMYGDGFTTGTMQRPWAPDPPRKVKLPKERQGRIVTPGQ